MENKQSGLRSFGENHLSGFQRLLVEISSGFIHLRAEEIDPAIDDALKKMAEYVGADRCYVFDYDFAQQICINTHEWCKAGIEPQIDNLQAVPLSAIPQWVETHRRGREMSIADVQVLEPGGLRDILEAQDIVSLISVPMMHGDQCIGFIGFDSVVQKRKYHDTEKGLLNIFSNILVNVRERKRALELAMLTERRYEEIMQVISDVIWRYEVDASGQFVAGYISPAVDGMLGLPPGTIGNDFEKYFSFIHPEDVAESLEKLKAAIAAMKSFDSHEYRLVRPDGTVAWIYTRGTVRCQANGRVIAYGSSTDITERVVAVEEVKKLNRELEQRVIDRTAQLEESKNELEAFCYSVSHDLRAPIRAMNSFARILREEHGSRLDTEGQRLTGIISGNAMKMGELIDDLLSLSRLGRHEIDFCKVDMKAMAEAAYNEVVKVDERGGITFYTDDIPPCTGDAPLLKQVWVNLLSNAVKFSSKKQLREIRIGSYADKEGAVYFVRDNGAGFDMAYAGKLFGVFQRLHNVKDYEGNGVGLAIVSRIIQRMKGRIWAEGQVGVGATFYFWLPRAGV